MAVDLNRIERGMANGADAVDSNFQSIQTELNTPQIQTQKLTADNGGQWVTESARVTKQGRIVTIQYNGKNANNTLGEYITTVPSWAKPMEKVRGAGFETDGSYHNWSVCNVWVDPSGALNLQSNNAYSFFQFTITYVSAN